MDVDVQQRWQPIWIDQYKHGAEILDKVGTYGKQIGQLGDALRALLDQLASAYPELEKQDAVKDVRLQLDEIDSLKRKRRNAKPA
jgi:hypothetical protein